MPILPLQTSFVSANIVLAQSIQTDLEQFNDDSPQEFLHSFIEALQDDLMRLVAHPYCDRDVFRDIGRR